MAIPARNGSEFNPELVGGALRRARESQRLSVRGLARDLGCSASLISQIERGLTSPSVGMLYSMAARLNVSIDRLLASSEQGDQHPPGHSPVKEFLNQPAMSSSQELLRSLPRSPQAQIQRKAHRQAVTFANQVRWERLTTTSEGSLDFLEVVYPPGSASTENDALVGHEGFEYGVVLEGALTIRVGNDEFVLEAGDSIAFGSQIPHRFHNGGRQSVRAIWFVTQNNDA